MSEILGEARILIRPDTALFRTQLEEQLAFARKPIVVPLVVGTAGKIGADVGSLQQQIANQRIAATKGVAAAEKSAVTSSEQLAAATQAVALSQKGLIPSHAAEAAAARAAALANKELQAALLTEDAALIGATAKTAQLAEAQVVAAGAARTHAAAQTQVGKGVFAATASQLGLRGATLAAGAAFIAGAAGTKIATAAIAAASDRTEQLNKSVEVFVGSAPQIQAWAQTTASTLGISETAALAAASTFGGLFRTLGILPSRAAELSQSLVKLGSDLASFNNVGTDRALAAIQSGLVGQARPLRALNIFLTESIVRQEAFAETGKRSAEALTQQDKILARYALIVRQAGIQTGDFERTSGRLANQSRILQANLSNLAAGIGSELIPEVTGLTKATNKALEALNKLPHVKVGPPGFSTTVGEVFKWASGWGEAKFLIDHATTSTNEATKSVSRVGAAMKDATGSVRGLSDVMGVLGDSTQATTAKLNDAANAAGRVAAATLRAQAASPTGELTPQQQIAQSTADIAAQQKIVAASKSGSKARNDALRAIAQDKRDRANAQKQIASNAVDQANQAKAASQKAQDASDAADQAIIKAISGGETKLTDQLILAGPKKTIAIDKQIVQFFKDAIKRVRETVKNAQTAADEISVLTTAMLNAVKQLKSDQAARDQAIADAAQSAADARQTHLEALLSIAETTPSKSDDRRRLQDIIDFDTNRIEALKKIRKKTQAEKAEIDALRVDRAQRRQALKALTDETKKNLTAQAEFNFLQTQTGFVSNLLGNLIPGGATAGLVGGGGGPSVPSNVRPTGQLSAAQTTSQANLVRGVSAGQAETQTFWLKQIAKILKDMHQGDAHPEAHKQRRTGAAVMDFQSATPGF